MIQKSAREIIQNATTLANARNTAFIDFPLATNLLNIEYRRLYDDVVTNSLDFVTELKLEAEETILPDDCYHVISVIDGNGDALLRQPVLNERDVRGFCIQNGVLKTKQYKGAILRYSPIPDTITAPDKAEEITDETVLNNIPTDGGIYNVEGDDVHSLTFTSHVDATQVIGYKTYQCFNYCGGILVLYIDPATNILSEAYWTDTVRILKDIVDPQFNVYEAFRLVTSSGDFVPVNIQVSDPYIICTYLTNISKKTMYIFTGFDKTIWNYNIIKGQPTYGSIVAFTANDNTGKGVVWHDAVTNKYYYCSFVPDTILSYPTSVLFTLLEYRLAAQIVGLTGMENKYLTEKLIPEAEIQFYKTLSFGNTSSRINNVNRRYLHVIQ